MNCFILIPLFTESLDENKEDIRKSTTIYHFSYNAKSAGRTK